MQTVRQNMEISQVPFLASLLTRPLLCNRCLGAHAWSDSLYIFCVNSRRALWEDFSYFLRGGGTLDPQVDSRFLPDYMAEEDGSGMHYAGFAGEIAPRAVFPTIAAMTACTR